MATQGSATGLISTMTAAIVEVSNSCRRPATRSPVNSTAMYPHSNSVPASSVDAGLVLAMMKIVIGLRATSVSAALRPPARCINHNAMVSRAAAISAEINR